MTRNGVILAGGRATRLGPLSSQLSKAVVSVRSKPQLVNQVLWMRAGGIDGDIVVVVNRSTQEQVTNVIVEAGLRNVYTGLQANEGVADAVCSGLELLNENPTLVIMSDTIVNEVGIPLERDWVGTAYTEDTSRKWTYLDDDRFVKDTPVRPCDVTIGVYMIQEPDLFIKRANRAEPDIVDTLNRYFDDHLFVDFPSWRDAGDLATMAHEHGSRFMHREHNDVQRLRNSIVKRSTNPAELMMLETMKDEARTWFPEVRWVKWDDATHSSGYVVMDYVDYPTLAETYLYWPVLEDQWRWILEQVVTGVRAIRGEHDWRDPIGIGNPVNFYSRITTRYTELAQRDDVWADRWGKLDCGYAVQELVNQTHNDTWAWGHGDPNFTNILMSQTGAAMKFIDPRGGWIPWSYEMAKIAYSPVFARIVHDLYPHVSKSTHNRDRYMMEWIIDELECDIFKTKASVALAFLSGAPLHNPVQSAALFDEGLRVMHEVLK